MMLLSNVLQCWQRVKCMFTINCLLLQFSYHFAVQLVIILNILCYNIATGTGVDFESCHTTALIACTIIAGRIASNAMPAQTPFHCLPRK